MRGDGAAAWLTLMRFCAPGIKSLDQQVYGHTVALFRLMSCAYILCTRRQLFLGMSLKDFKSNMQLPIQSRVMNVMKVCEEVAYGSNLAAEIGAPRACS